MTNIDSTGQEVSVFEPSPVKEQGVDVPRPAVRELQSDGFEARAALDGADLTNGATHIRRELAFPSENLCVSSDGEDSAADDVLSGSDIPFSDEMDSSLSFALGENEGEENCGQCFRELAHSSNASFTQPQVVISDHEVEQLYRDAVSVRLNFRKFIPSDEQATRRLAAEKKTCNRRILVCNVFEADGEPVGSIQHGKTFKG